MQRGSENKRGTLGQKLPVVMASLVAIEAFVIMVGWWLESAPLVQPRSGWAPTQFNTAFGMLLGACGVLANESGRRRLAMSCSGGVLLLTTLSLVQYATDSSFGIDDLLARPFVTDATSHPGRISPNAGVCLAALAIAELVRASALSFRLAAAGVLSGMVAGWSLVTLMTYWLGLPANIGFRDLTEMAFPAALGILLLALTSLGAALRMHRQSFPGVHNPWLPSIVGSSFALASVALWAALIGQHEQALALQLRLSAELIERDLVSAVGRGFQALLEPTAPDFSRELFLEGPTVRAPHGLPEVPPGRPNSAEDTRRLVCAAERGQIWLGVRKGRETLWGRLDLAPPVRSVLGARRDLGYRIWLDDACLVEVRGGDGDGHLATLGRAEVSGHRLSIRVWSERSGHTTTHVIVLFLGLFLAVSVSFLVAEAQSARARKTELEAWVEGAPLALVLVDRDGRIVRTNHLALALFGESRSAVDGTDLEAWIPEASLAEQSAWRRRLTATDGTAGPGSHLIGERGYVELHRRDGGRVPLEMGVGAVAIAGREHLLCAATNIDERLRTAEALEQGARELTAANEELKRFSYVLSHDLRAPIRGMAMLADFIQQDDGEQLSEAGREHLALLRRRGAIALRMVEGLLDLARMERSSQEKENLDLGQLVRDAFELVSAPPDFRLVVDPSLPRVYAVRAALLQVLFNLLNNAVRHHTRSDGCVRVSADRDGRWMKVQVQDDGPGLTEEQRRQAFDVFRRFKSPPSVSQQEEGLGLGLALVKKRVELVKGRVQLRAASGGGLLVEFTWPLGF